MKVFLFRYRRHLCKVSIRWNKKLWRSALMWFLISDILFEVLLTLEFVDKMLFVLSRYFSSLNFVQGCFNFKCLANLMKAFKASFRGFLCYGVQVGLWIKL